MKKRREQLKKFNYSFNSNLSKIEEIENQLSNRDLDELKRILLNVKNL